MTGRKAMGGRRGRIIIFANSNAVRNFGGTSTLSKSTENTNTLTTAPAHAP